MPIKKYRSLEEKEEACWLDKNDPALWRRIASIWRFSQLTAPQHFVPGVHKYTSFNNCPKKHNS